MEKLLEKPLTIINKLLEAHKEPLGITKFEVNPINNENIFKCIIYFNFTIESGVRELEVFFIWNLSGKKMSPDKYKIIYSNIAHSSTGIFLAQLISSRIKGEKTELRALAIAEKVAKEIENISPTLKVLKVQRGGEYADLRLKMDLQFVISYNYSGMFDHIKSVYTFIIGIQVKSSKRFQDKHREKYPFHPSIVIEEGVSDSLVKEMMMNLLKNICKFKIEELYATFIKDFKLKNKGSIYYIKRVVSEEINELHV